MKSVLFANGPFLLKSITSNHSLYLKRNHNYWDKKNVHVSEVNLLITMDQTKIWLHRGFSDGAYTVARLFPSSSNFGNSRKIRGDNNIYNTPAGSGVAILGFQHDRHPQTHCKEIRCWKIFYQESNLEQRFASQYFALNRETTQHVNGSLLNQLSVLHMLHLARTSRRKRLKWSCR